jgi:hypothetical protein
MLAIDKNPAEEEVIEARQVGIDAQEIIARRRLRTRVPRDSRAMASGRRVDSSQLTFDGSYISLAKSPLASFLERRNDIAPRKFIHRIRAKVEQKRDLAGIKQYVVFIGHVSPTRRLTFGILSGRDFVVCAYRRSQG